MSRKTGRLLALLTTLGLALAAYFIQPANLAIFGNPTNAGIILGAVMIGLGVFNNWLPSLFQPEAVTKPPPK